MPPPRLPPQPAAAHSRRARLLPVLCCLDPPAALLLPLPLDSVAGSGSSKLSSRLPRAVRRISMRCPRRTCTGMAECRYRVQA